MTTMARLLRGLCSDESLPNHITFISNGTKTVLMKTLNEDDEPIYVGSPTYKSKGKWRTLPYSLVICPTKDKNNLLEIDGRNALNCIAQGGWNPSSKRPTESDRNEIRSELTTTLVLYCAEFASKGEQPGKESIVTAIEEETGYSVVKEAPTDDDLDNMAAAGIKGHIVDYLVRSNWKLNISTESLMRRIENYAEVVKGDWTPEASNIATTSGTNFSVVSILRKRGYTLRKRTRRNKKSMTK